VKVGCPQDNRPDTLPALMRHLHDCGLHIVRSDCAANTNVSQYPQRQVGSAPAGFVGTFSVCDRRDQLPSEARRDEIARGIRSVFGGSAIVEFPTLLSEAQAVHEKNAAPTEGPALCKHSQPAQTLQSAQRREGRFRRLSEGVRFG
jgi:hypothetical protein